MASKFMMTYNKDSDEAIHQNVLKAFNGAFRTFF